MAQQTINIGASPNDGTGTPLRTAFQYTNSNFSELYTAVGPSGNNIVVPGTATITGDLTVDTSTLKVDSANNRVGIGTASPAQKLSLVGDTFVASSFNGAAYGDAAAERLRIGYKDGTPDTGLVPAQIVAQASVLQIATRDIANGTLTFHTGTGVAERYRIDGIGVSTWSISGSTAMTLNSTGLGVGVVPSAGKGALQLSSGINFPATQVASSDANTLDDYEEGTWVPVITAGSGTPTTVTVNSAVYTKIGRVVVLTFDFSVVNKGTASSSLQFGLPITSITSTAFCGSFREDGSTGNMGMVIYSTGTTAACLLYNNATPWVDGYRLKGTYTYFSA